MPAFTTAIGATILGALAGGSAATGASMAVGAAAYATAVGVAATAATAAGAYYGINAMMSQPNKAEPIYSPSQQQANQSTATTMATAPTGAAEVAKESEARRRRMSLMNGGETLLSTESPLITSTTGKALIGS